MSKRQILMLLGVWVMLFFVLGFPGNIKEIIAIVTGALIIFVAYRLGTPDSAAKSKTTMSYTEHRREAAPTAPISPITHPQDQANS